MIVKATCHMNYLHMTSGNPSPEWIAARIPEIVSSSLGLERKMKKLIGRFFGRTRSRLPV